jgi:tripartite-type tricarboxylate transporter receptor subunit TctC
MRYVKTSIVLALTFICVLGFINLSAAEGFSDKPVRLIVPYPAGGGHGLLARGFQIPFEKALQTKVVVENIPGGSTKLGTMEVMKAKPDGHTLFLLVYTALVGNYYAGTYDSKVWQSLSPIGSIAFGPYGMFEVKASAPFGTWSELVKHAKANPGKMNCGGPGTSGMMNLIFTEVTKAAGIKCMWVPFAGDSGSKTALLGGHVDFRICSTTSAFGMIKAGETKGIAISTDERYMQFKDVPSFKELGIGEGIWLDYVIWGPPEMPKQIVDTLAAAIKTAIKDPAYVKFNEDTLTNGVRFKTGSIIKEDLQQFDRKFGPKLAAMYR